MPGLKLTASLPQLDRERYLRDLKASVDKAVIKAARAFLVAAIPHIPVFTGFARGSLGNLEDIAGRGGTNPRAGGYKRTVYYKGKNYYYYPPGGGRVVRTNVSGRQFATPSNQIMSEGRVTRATVGSRSVFKFEVNITYFDFLDQKWGSFAAGKAAFTAELKRQLELLKPDIGKYLIRKG